MRGGQHLSPDYNLITTSLAWRVKDYSSGPAGGHWSHASASAIAFLVLPGQLSYVGLSSLSMMESGKLK